jgi:aspartate/methionine/tyrosine aminotransferase
VRVREVKLSFDSGYRLDPGKIGASLSPKTRLVSIASPQNPSGVSAPRAAVEELLKLIESVCPKAVLFVDETYREATYGDAVAAESVAGLHPRVVTGASVSKALGAPGLRAGWLTVPDAELRSRIAVARMNIVLSGSVLDEALAAVLLRDKEAVLGPRRLLLAGALQQLAEWCEGERRRIDWVRPDAGALSCLRLRADPFDRAAVARFWDVLPGHDVQLAPGTWFGEGPRVFRLGFGYLPPNKFGPALAAQSAALDAALA